MIIQRGDDDSEGMPKAYIDMKKKESVDLSYYRTTVRKPYCSDCT